MKVTDYIDVRIKAKICQVKLQDIAENPFHDLVRYPLREDKVQQLISSYKETGFWPGGLNGREKNGEIEIPFGHHRLEALKGCLKLDDEIDMFIWPISDEDMLRMLTAENLINSGSDLIVVENTIEDNVNWLKKQSYVHKIDKRGKHRNVKCFKNRPLPKEEEAVYSIISWQVSQYMGPSNLSEKKVYQVINRLKGYGALTYLLREDDEGHIIEKLTPLNPEAIHLMPSLHAANRFAVAVKKIKGVTFEQQMAAARQIIEIYNFSEWGIERVIYEEKLGPKIKKDKKQFEIANFFYNCSKRAEKLVANIEQIMERKNHPVFVEYLNGRCPEARTFTLNIRRLLNVLREYFGGEELIKIINKLIQEKGVVDTTDLLEQSTVRGGGEQYDRTKIP